MKKLVVLFLVLVTLFASVVAVAEEIPNGIPAVVHSNTLSLREEPKTSARRIENLRNGDFVVIPYDAQGNVWSNGYDFVYVWHDGNYGWVLSKLLTEHPRYLVSADKTPTVYASPSMKVEITDHLDPEETILILEEVSNGYVVNFRNTAGFVPYGENTYVYERVGTDAYNYLNNRWGLVQGEAILYTWPDEISDQVTTYFDGQPVNINGEWNGFYRASIGAQTVYIKKDVIKLQ